MSPLPKGNLAVAVKSLQLLLCVALSAIALPAAAEERGRVLMIYPNLDVSPWVQRYNQAIYKHLRVGDEVTVEIELLDLAQYVDDEKMYHARAIYNMHRRFPPDLVIGILPTANDFVENYSEVFAPGAKVLYVLPSRDLEQRILAEGRQQYVKSAWEVGVADTLKLMRSMFPERNRYFMVSGSTPGNLSYYERSEGVLTEHGIEAEALKGIPPDEAIEIINSAGSDAMVLYLTFDQDINGNRYSGPQMMKRLSQGVEAPIFSVLDTVLGHGVLGGSFTGAELYGERAAETARRMLVGEAAPVFDHYPIKRVFDYTVMSRFGLSREDLPQDAKLINYTESVLSRYRIELILVGVVMLIQTLLIAALVYVIRQRRKLEREREDQIRLFESVINTIQDAIVVTDNNGKVIVTNSPGFQRAFGYMPTAFLGKSYRDLFDSELPLDAMTLTVVSCLHRSGSLFPGETNIERVVDSEGESAGYLFVIRDVSGRLAQEGELRHAHKMEAIGNLAGGIAHDFNNVLMAILGNTEIASDTKTSEAERQASLDRIMAAGLRARDLTREILTFSHRGDDAGREQLDLGELIRESIGLVRASFPSSVDLDVEINEKLWQINGNATQLQQVILNLCSNANHAMEGVGQVLVSAENLHLEEPRPLYRGMLPSGDYIVLSISDTGSGIEAELLDRIFEPFFTTKQRGEGTGMGLALVYRIVEEHAGLLDLQTGSLGTTFRLFLPVSQVESEQPAEEPVSSNVAPEKLRILLVDDDELVLEANSSILRQCGHHVSTFIDPCAALAAFREAETEFDLVITDQTMPGMDGRELARTIQLEQDIPVMICSGNRDIESIAQTKTLKVLAKPFTSAELSNAIGELTSSTVPG